MLPLYVILADGFDVCEQFHRELDEKKNNYGSLNSSHRRNTFSDSSQVMYTALQ